MKEWGQEHTKNRDCIIAIGDTFFANAMNTLSSKQDY